MSNLTTTINGQTYEALRFPMKTLNISQGTNGSYSHQGTNAIDITGASSSSEPTYAPCTMKRKFYDSAANGNAVIFQSEKPVFFADGTIDYATMMFIHDDDISDILALGDYTFDQWEEFGDEGTAGNATGIHCHFEIAKGKYTGTPYVLNSSGVYQLPNAISPDKACFVDGVTIRNNGQPTGSGGSMTWKKLSDVAASSSVTVPTLTNEVYRLYSGNEHFFTASHNEAQTLVNLGWTYEGAAFKCQSSGTAVYRLYNPNSGIHIFTASLNEKTTLVSAGWNDEGTAFYVSGSGNAVYRAYNPNSGEHMLTTSYYEKSQLVAAGWTDEGIAFYAD